MAWEKLGLIHCLPSTEERATTHMQGPVAILLEDRIRVYFAARNRFGKSYPAYLDVDFDNPTRLIAIHDSPVVPYGPLGTFDDEGIMPACIVRAGNALLMYYSGWNRRVTIPYHNTTGIAISHDHGNSFSRMFDGPILDRTPQEPYMAVTPWVMREDSFWRMWYVSGLCWETVGGVQEPIYVIKHATSTNGIAWNRSGVLSIPQSHPREAMARPTVAFRNGIYHMWFCYRDSINFRDGDGSYRIGYASSLDGVTWKRDDKLAGIDVSESGWDSKMLCYPYVIEVKGRLHMFYNGNSFGQTGIGYAIWDGDLS